MLVGQVGKVGSDWRGGGRCGRLATTAWVDNRTVGRPHAVASTAGRGWGGGGAGGGGGEVEGGQHGS